jgi:hypothetical integral membrane protein (TIGR02206 family)
MQTHFRIFGLVHLAILGAIPAFAAILAWIQRRLGRGKGVRLELALVLLLNAVVWYSYMWMRGWLSFPQSLPLELCDATLCLAFIALLTLNPTIFDLAYYGGLAGTSMALLTPDLWEPFPSFSTVEFFVMHGLVVVAVLYLVWSREARPRPGSIWRALLGVNIYAAAVGTFNFIFKTNYMYLRSKPANPSLLDYLGAWPWYIASSEVVALLLFALLYLPFWRRSDTSR